IGVGRSRRGAFELPVFLRQLMRGGDEKLRMPLLDQPLGTQFVLRMAVGMQKQDRNRLRTVAHGLVRRCQNLRIIEGQQYATLPVHPLSDLKPQRSVDQWFVLAKE